MDSAPDAPDAPPAPQQGASSGSSEEGKQALRKKWQVDPAQQVILERAYLINIFPNADARKQLATQLNVTPLQIQVWFQNRRQRERKSSRLGPANSLPPYKPSMGCSATSLDSSPAGYQGILSLHGRRTASLDTLDHRELILSDLGGIARQRDGVWDMAGGPLPLVRSGCSDLLGSISLTPSTEAAMSFSHAASDAASTSGSTTAGSSAETEVAAFCPAAQERERSSVAEDHVQVITHPAPPYHVVYVSKAWQQLCGYSAEEAVGRTLHLIQGPLTCKQKLQDLKKALENDGSPTVSLVNYTAKNVAFSHQLHVEPLRDTCGVVQFLQGSSSDICLLGPAPGAEERVALPAAPPPALLHSSPLPRALPPQRPRSYSFDSSMTASLPFSMPLNLPRGAPQRALSLGPDGPLEKWAREHSADFARAAAEEMGVALGEPSIGPAQLGQGVGAAMKRNRSSLGICDLLDLFE